MMTNQKNKQTTGKPTGLLKYLQARSAAWNFENPEAYGLTPALVAALRGEYQALSFEEVILAGRARRAGARKYGPDTWVKVPVVEYEEALGRHLEQILFSGNPPDLETGLTHTCHALWNLESLLALRAK